MSQPFPYWHCNIGSGNSLLLSGKKPLPEPVLTQIFVNVCVARAKWVNPFETDTVNIGSGKNGLLSLGN